MFISLKWKAGVFLSLVLIALTSAWSWQSISKSQNSFDKNLAEKHIYYQELLNEVISDNYLKLSQFSQLMTEKKVVSEALNNKASNENDTPFLREWASYNINLGLDYLAVFNHEKEVLAETKSDQLNSNLSQFRNVIIKQYLHKATMGEPQSYIYCDDACLLVMVEPMVNAQGKSGIIVLAQNMADIVRSFHSFSKASLGIFIKNKKPDLPITNDRHINQWNSTAWAVSQFKTMFPVFKNYSESGLVNDNVNFELFFEEDNKYFIKKITGIESDVAGQEVSFITLSDETESYNQMRFSIISGVITSILVLFIAEVILFLLINRLMRKLINISDALLLLPKQLFNNAEQKVNSGKSYIRDELTTLENSTAYVAKELNKLHSEIDVKNQSLNQQISVLARSRAFLTRLFDNSHLFIVTQGTDFELLSTNKKFNALFVELPSRYDLILSDSSLVNEFTKEVDKLKKQLLDVVQLETVLIDKFNNQLTVLWVHSLVEDEDGNEIILSIGTDLTQQKRAENDLRWMANHDSLTGLGNRRAFNQKFDDLLKTRMRGALVFIDVNRFKQINDIYGHHVGDKVLIDIAESLTDVVRGHDVVCRLAGDEFILILTRIAKPDLVTFLDKLSVCLSRRIQVDAGTVCDYTVSIGASVFPEQGNDAQKLIVYADMAMYSAKKKGAGHWYIYDLMDDAVSKITHDHDIVLKIRYAIKFDSLFLVYQPIMNIKTQTISHYEVLLRLRDEDDNLISPAIFIPIAEKMGEIRHIDEWVIDHALSSLKDLGDNQSRFAINISAPTLQSENLPEMLKQYISHYDVDPGRLIVELTETAYIENFQIVLHNLNLIADYGVQVALDDFGVGFSSFTYLKKLPLTYVKLDGSYIRNLTKFEDDQVFVKSLAAMITGFGMKTIAEFVEDGSTLDMLDNLGVTYGQGYFIGKPESFSDTFNLPKSIN